MEKMFPHKANIIFAAVSGGDDGCELLARSL